MSTHQLSTERLHFAWDNSLEPVLEIEPGSVLELQTRDASNGHFSACSTVDHARHMPPFRGHPLTGPVFVKGAQPGDVLEIHIRQVRTDSWGWTVVLPGRGLLQEDFAEHHLRIWDLSDGLLARWCGDFAVPIEPFCGVVGVAPAELGQHSTNPPGRHGGNMDLKQLAAGSCLYLPVFVPGALLSLGDAHAAQGDGEVCVTAIETNAEVAIEVGLRKDLTIPEPQVLISRPLLSATNSGPWYATTAAATDLMQATKQAVRYMIQYLVREHGLTEPDAYILASVTADLKISEVVDAPNWLVSAFLPLSIFTNQ